MNVASERVGKAGTTRVRAETQGVRRRVAPALPTLIHPLPTLRRVEPAMDRQRLRRNNEQIFSGRTTFDCEADQASDGGTGRTGAGKP